jgi:predicted transcriptional regulator
LSVPAPLKSPVLGSTIDEIASSMAALAETDRNQGSRRSIFVKLYSIVTSTVRERISQGGYFEDDEWAGRYLVAFANLYASARYRYDRGETVPKAWRIAFRTADQRSGLVLQDLLLGVNAHINHDLAFALVEATIEPQRQMRHRDHTAVNAILEGLTNASQEKIAALYAPGLRLADELAGPVDEIASAFSIEHARENAWRQAVALTTADNKFETSLVKTGLDLQSAVLARLILAPVRIVPGLRAAFEAVEQGFRLG